MSAFPKTRLQFIGEKELKRFVARCQSRKGETIKSFGNELEKRYNKALKEAGKTWGLSKWKGDELKTRAATYAFGCVLLKYSTDRRKQIEETIKKDEDLGDNVVDILKEAGKYSGWERRNVLENALSSKNVKKSGQVLLNRWLRYGKQMSIGLDITKYSQEPVFGKEDITPKKPADKESIFQFMINVTTNNNYFEGNTNAYNEGDLIEGMDIDETNVAGGEGEQFDGPSPRQPPTQTPPTPQTPGQPPNNAPPTESDFGIYGRVTDAATGEMVAGALIVITPPGRGPMILDTKTHQSGQYSRAVPNVATYSVSCNASGYDTEEHHVNITHDHSWREVNFSLHPIKKKEPPKKRPRVNVFNRVEFSKYLLPFVIVMAGVMISYLSGCVWLMLGFVSWAVLFVIPQPFSLKELKDMNMMVNVKMEDESTFSALRKYMSHSPHNTGLGIVRGFLKVTAICLFVAGIKFCLMPFQATLLIIVAFVGYFSMSTEVDKENPSTIIESLIRFGVLGFFVIPFWIFWSQFNSLALALIALAFFAVPPVYKTETEGQKDMTGIFSKFFFALVMLLALFGSGVITGFSLGPSWELHGALKVVFIYFWVVCGVAGFFASTEARPPIGLFMLLVALIIYGMSSGLQDVGAGLFGPYFPDVYTGVMTVAKPINDAFLSMSGTFGTAWMLISDPVGYAQGIMNPTYANDEVSDLTGPLGVEIKSVEVTPIQPYMPYTVMVGIQNKGASKAWNVLINITALATWSPKSQEISISKEKMTLGEIGFVPLEPTSYTSAITCYDEYGDQITDAKDYDDIVTCSQEAPETSRGLERLDMRTVMFDVPEDGGLDCETINKYALRESTFRKKWGIQFIPVKASVSYDYSMAGTLDVSFVSRDEWTRLAQYEEGFNTQKKEAATNTNSPAFLKIDTIQQPIREGTPFTLAIVLEPAEGRKGEIVDVHSLELTIPEALVDEFEFCRPESDEELVVGEYVKDDANPDGTVTLVWTKAGRVSPISYVLCRFKPVELDGKATTSYLIQANATFRFSVEEDVATKVEWSGEAACCTRDSHCPNSDIQYCDTNQELCVLRERVEQRVAVFGTGEYCAILKENNPSDRSKWCAEGDGRCDLDSDQCAPNFICSTVPVSGKDLNLCCTPYQEEECSAAHLAKMEE